MRFRWGGNFARVVPPSIDRKRRREAASFPRLSNTASRIAFRVHVRVSYVLFSLSLSFIRLLLIFFSPPFRRNFVPFFFCARIRSEIVTRCAMIFNSTRNSLAIVIKGDRKKGIVE